MTRSLNQRDQPLSQRDQRSFIDLGLRGDIVGMLNSYGIVSPFPIQALTIPDALAGKDVCGKAKTGSGKTLAFGLPVLQMLAKAESGMPTGLVLVPTRELASQIHSELIGVAGVVQRKMLAVYGGAPIEDQIDGICAGVDFLIATPGRVIDLINRGDVSMAAVAHVVVDEADRMADMGFLPQVEWILRGIERPHQTLLFSATLDGAVDVLVRRYQNSPVVCEVMSQRVTVDKMTHRFVGVHELDKVKVVAAIAGSVKKMLVFTKTRIAAEHLSRDLRREGVRTNAIHGNQRQVARERSLQGFVEGSFPVLVATDVAARGIHVDDVDVVVQYNPPSDHKSYIHRAGRTARAGESGMVVTLSLWNEELAVKRIQRSVGLDEPIVQMLSNDPRLVELASYC